MRASPECKYLTWLRVFEKVREGLDLDAVFIVGLPAVSVIAIYKYLASLRVFDDVRGGFNNFYLDQ